MQRWQVKNHMTKAIRTAGCLTQVVWHNKYLKIHTKIRIYKGVIRIAVNNVSKVPVITFDTETWGETAKTRQQIAACKITVLRRIINKTKRDRKPNSCIRQTFRMFGNGYRKNIAWTSTCLNLFEISLRIIFTDFWVLNLFLTNY